MPSFLLIFALLVVDSLHFIFARLLHPHSPPTVSVLFVLAVATLEVGAYTLLTGRMRWEEIRRGWWLFAVIGLLIAASTSINYQAVAFIDPGIASVLAQTGTVWAVLFGLLWLRESLTPGQVVGAALAMVGVFVVNYQAGDYVQTGSLLVLLSSALYALHAALTKKFTQEMDLATFFFARLLFSTLAIFIFNLFSGALAVPQASAWPFILLAGTIDVSVSRALYYFALRRLKLTVHTILLTLSPIIAILWSIALFNSHLTARQGIGGLVVLGGVLMVALLADRRTVTD